MFPKLSAPNAPQPNLRRPYSTRREQFDMPQPEYNYSHCNLDLSVHRPSTPFGNRFAPLAQPEAVLHRDGDFYTSRQHRRSRNSRGTKEAKKRRDSRRNKRKFDVHLLDEKLSRDIEETLTQYNIRPPPPVSSMMPTTSVSEHVHNAGPTYVAPSAPQLPPITFHGFSVPDFPPLILPRIGPQPSPQHMLPGVPAWCPPISSLTSTGSHSGELPKFYDLSCLQEPKRRPSQETQCKDLQLWRGNSPRMPEKQSRFFPPRPTSPKATVRLPPAGPKSSIPGAGIHDPLDAAWKSPNVAPRPGSITEAIERIITATTVAEAEGQEHELPSAANLWNIIAQPSAGPTDFIGEHDWVSKEQETDTEELPMPVFNGQLAPFELAGSDVPYVHDNSLTGYANETAANHSERNVMDDSAIYLTEMFSSSKNAPPAYELPSPLSPCVYTPEDPTFEQCAAILPPDTFEVGDAVNSEAKSGCTGEQSDNSAAHFNSEQELFSSPLAMKGRDPSPSASFCDLATFLSMGHAEKCWCLACIEEPELVSEGTSMEPEDSLTEDDGWMVWSTTDCEDGSTTVAEADVASEEPRTAESVSSQQGVQCDMWEGFVPRKPRRARALIECESEVRFVGYYDNGAAFEHGRARVEV